MAKETDRSTELKGSAIQAYLHSHSTKELAQETDELMTDLKNLLGTSVSALMEMHPECGIISNIGVSITVSACDKPFLQGTYGAANGVKKALKMAVDTYNETPDAPSFKDTLKTNALDDSEFIQFLEKEADKDPTARLVLEGLKGTDA